MLIKTVGKKPDLFCYYVSLLEARKLLENIKEDNLTEIYEPVYVKLITEG